MAPTWAPSLVQVANYVPGRTLAVDDVAGAPNGTFGATTRPTDTQVSALIADACTWVLQATGPLVPTVVIDPTSGTKLIDSATIVAAVRAAAFVEISWPERDADINTGQVLLEQADRLRADLVAANHALTGTDEAHPVLMPSWSMPAPEAWGDETFY